MPRSILAAALVVAAASLTACGSVAPDAGTEAVLVRKPFFFGHGGVDQTPIKTGRSFVAWSTDAVYVDMQPKRIDLDFDDLLTKNGVPLDFHAALTCKVLNSPVIVEKFGADTIDGARPMPGWFARNLEQPLRTAVRDAVKAHDMQEMAITATASADVDAVVTDALTKLVASLGLPVDCRDVSLGRANPPDAIKTQRVATAAQEQRIQTEQQREQAEINRKKAETARAAADNAYREAIGMTPAQFHSTRKHQDDARGLRWREMHVPRGWRRRRPDVGRPMTLPAVEGRVCQRTLGAFEQACLVHLAEEQERPNPDTALIGLLCDAVRLAREHADSANGCVIGAYCRRHGYVHGGESEELRKRFERLVSERPALDKDAVRTVLYEVDSRDSLSWLERQVAGLVESVDDE